MNDFKFALRQWLKHPGLAAVILVSLSIGIGANTVVFSWIRATLFDAIPGAAEPSRLAVVSPQHQTGGINDTMSLADIESLAAETRIFAGLTASQFDPVSVRLNDSPEWLWGQQTLANFFDVLGVSPVLGRGFVAGEDRPGAPAQVAVISHALWQQRFQSASNVIGRVIQVNQRPVTIVGVAPPNFPGSMGGLRMDLWIPLATRYEDEALRARYTSRSWRWLHTVARLQDGVSFRSAQAAAHTVGRRLAAEFPENKDTTLRVLRVWESTWGGQAVFLPLLRVLAVVAGLLLLLVSANVANLLLVRAQARAAELGVRLALGASAGRVIRQLLSEGLLLALLGGAGGVALAGLGVDFLFALMPPTHLPLGYDLRLNWEVLAASMAVTLVTGLLFSLAPAWQAVRTDLNTTIKGGARGVSGLAPRQWLRRALVVGEVALALVMLIGMGLCARSLANARRVDLGLDPGGVWLAGFRLSEHATDDATARQFYRRLRTAAAQLPGARSAALSDWFPLGFEGGSSSGFTVPGYTPAPGEAMAAGVAIVSPRYFETLRIPLHAGREFLESDDLNAPPVAVVNEAFARKYFVGRDAVGLTFKTGRAEFRIVGVSRTGKYRQLNEPARPFFFLCSEQFGSRSLGLAVRAEGDPRFLALPVENLGVSLDPHGRPHSALSYEDYSGAAFAIPRVAAMLLGFLGSMALLLAVMGIYAVMAHNVGQRTREIGVRLALGARPCEVRWMILRQGAALTVLGVGAGALAAVGVSRLLAGLLVGVSAADLLTWVLVPVILLAAALLACWLPARRAAKVDPMEALRCE